MTGYGARCAAKSKGRLGKMRRGINHLPFSDLHIACLAEFDFVEQSTLQLETGFTV